jgi:hypothetical protein
MVENCPGDWQAGNQIAVRGRLMKFIETGSTTLAYEAFQILKFREGAMEYAEWLLATFGIKHAYNGTY